MESFTAAVELLSGDRIRYRDHVAEGSHWLTADVVEHRPDGLLTLDVHRPEGKSELSLNLERNAALWGRVGPPF